MKTCTKCGEEKPLDGFYRQSRGAGGRFSRCKECQKKQVVEWRRANPGRRRLQPGARIRHLRVTYGMRPEDYASMLKAQRGACATCGVMAFDCNHGMLHVDHDHETGKVRGLLCGNCNRALGLVKEKSSTLLRLANYLRDAADAA